ncbi:hypothetical protein [Desulfosarcina ovata]|uniref:Uncharacterized protein n=1 Tax=Desulfosarcina ovata subsp. ovata TaxID=2752305 RepID=A0A5K8A3I5_9BACT|nr:hypothetical protein [Desulfosarcina ovata]BBO87021.1 hypothetical protein DSCOOX_02010 [Desulfosarcina ovata subsp. ovata]
MPRYEIQGKGKDTGRKRKRTYSAASESEARQLAEEDGTLIEEVTEIPPDPPTQRQIDYAKDLGISIPANATKDDVSDLISLKVDRDKPSTERHKKFARAYGIEFTDYIGKKALFNRIQAALVSPGREKKLLSWFTFRVYRELISGADNAPIDAPDDPIIEEIAEELVTDEKILKSVRRYEGSELIWFGEWTSPDGYVHTGGSNRTAAYKQVSSMLKERAQFPKNEQKKVRSSAHARDGNQKDRSEPKGCLSVMMVVLLISVGVVLSIAWIGKIFAYRDRE